MKNTGKEYELFVAKLQQAILDSDEFTFKKNIKVEVNKLIEDNCGIERQFDIYWEYELGGLVYKSVIECKDYNSDISVDKIDAFVGKARDIPDLKLVFATKKGYQSGAKKKAEQNKINLLIVRKQNDSDWMDENGTPLIKIIGIDFHIKAPAIIRTFNPVVDKEWLEKNTNLDVTKPIKASGMSTEIIIEDVINNNKYSINDLANSLTSSENEEYGDFTKVEKFEEAYITYSDLRMKLKGYKVEYSIAPPVIERIELDYSKELIGVIEYIEKGKKKTIFSDGIIKERVVKRIHNINDLR
ncbi:restriction endonuclease [Paenibacillus polymyxa]|uniref:restriction endonuclease n=1 Tax=Paenibacillus polymyxa TaxID=1406 RepID=UPI0020240E6C|nr:restriction endonuclease [Paenibacillus polymyxa]WDZ63535.1 restriction endonuclease [Paenibacillus polymyxa]